MMRESFFVSFLSKNSLQDVQSPAYLIPQPVHLSPFTLQGKKSALFHFLLYLLHLSRQEHIKLFRLFLFPVSDKPTWCGLVHLDGVLFPLDGFSLPDDDCHTQTSPRRNL